MLGPGPWVPLNKWMDQPARSLGTKHRKLRHADTDPASMFLAALLFGDSRVPQAMVIHTVRDRMQSEWNRAINKLMKQMFTPK
jgi:hypothetical protein